MQASFCAAITSKQLQGLVCGHEQPLFTLPSTAAAAALYRPCGAIALTTLHALLPHVLRLLLLLRCSLFQEVHTDLAKAAKQGKGAAVKVAAAEALALCCFVAAEDEHTTLEVMEQLHALWGKGGRSRPEGLAQGLWLHLTAVCCEDELTTLEVLEQLHGLWGKGGLAVVGFGVG